MLRAISERLGGGGRPDVGRRTGWARAAAFVKPLAGRPVAAAWPRCSRRHDEGILAAYVDDESDVSQGRLATALAAQTTAGARASGLLRLGDHGRRRRRADGRNRGAAPASDGRSGRRRPRPRSSRSSGPRAARRSPTSGCSRGRFARATACSFGRGLEGKVTAIAVFERGPAVQRPSVSAGAVAKLWGLAEIQIGDRIGEIGRRRQRARSSRRRRWSRSSSRRNPDDRARLRVALDAARRAGPADQRPAGRRVLNEISVSLYGEVQKEVIQATLADRLRPRGRLPRDDADLHRAAAAERRGGRGAARGDEPVPRHDRPPHRSGADGLGHRVPAGRRPADGAAVPLQDARAASRSTWRSTSARRCGRASTAGRSRTAS